ncbi:class I SAM-dependent methyltransferase [Caballeronia terrestris]|uniref:class I SAM-dependent methyltransferase n=1 Tax=Caballeronia terrestris TaxID=1226301 RepID=UPI001F24C38B|nr:class I SAM-dependent methyltransferase [Caballeronia terrestris]
MNKAKAMSGAMEGRGEYNRHSALQAAGGALALNALKQAAARVVLETADHPIVIADYGTSQGGNSQLPMRVAIAELRTRAGPNRPILVYHEDLPINDFGSLFKVLEADPDRYVRDDSHVYPCAIGRSFYESVLPPAYVHLGWSAYAAMWLSRVPVPVADHIYVPCMKGAASAAFHEQGMKDWQKFLSLRAAELRPGGRLVVVLPGADDDGRTGFEPLMNDAHDVLTQMADEGALTANERAHMVLATFGRPLRELLTAFAADGRCCQLSVEHCERLPLPDAVWDGFLQDGDRERMVSRYAAFYRSTFVPSLFLALAQPDDTQRKGELSDRFEHLLKKRLETRQEPIHSQVQTFVFARDLVP